MGPYLKIALRNVKRNTRRSLLAVISIALAVMLIITLQGMIQWMEESVITNSTKSRTGHIRIVTEQFQQNKQFLPVNTNVSSPGEIMSVIQQDPEIGKTIRTITPRFRFRVILTRNGKNKSAVALAGNPEKEKELLMLQESIKSGRYIRKPGETVIGSGIAETLGLAAGDDLNVLREDRRGKFRRRVLTVTGIFHTGLSSYDDRLFQIPLSDAERLLDTGNAAQQIIIMLHNYEKADTVAKRIQQIVQRDKLHIEAWMDSGSLLSYMEGARVIYNIIYLAVAFLGALIIVNIMMMVVMERRKEIGILKALGFSKPEILFIFFFEGSIIGCIGSFIGTAFGVLINIPLSIYGIDYGEAVQQLTIPMESTIKTELSFFPVLYLFFLGIGVSALISLYPAYKASRMDPVKAIQSVEI